MRRLLSFAELTETEERAVSGLTMHIREFRKDHDIIREGDRPSQCCVLLQGLACRYKLVSGGKRQIFSFQLAGDIPDLQGLQIEVMDHNIGTLTNCTVGFVPYPVMTALMDAYPRIARALWRDVLVETSILREWMATIGRRPAYVRIAHLLCEMMTRLAAIGKVANFVVELPITQDTVADALGLSTVHVNRVIQALRREGLITMKGGVVTAIDWEGLKVAGEFDPAYLHLRTQPLP